MDWFMYDGDLRHEIVNQSKGYGSYKHATKETFLRNHELKTSLTL